MRHSCFFAAISLTLLNLSGCGLEDTGESAFNPATNVDLAFSTFDLENTEQVPDNLEYTRFRDFYQGIQPSGPDDSADNRETANEIRAHIDRFIQATRAENSNSYEKVRNPLDLINQVIASNQVTNFREGRTYISQRIAAGQAGTYNTRGNGALIRFTDQNAVLSDKSLNDKLWVFSTLDWRYLPVGPEGSDLDAKVYRTIQYVSRSVEPEAAEAQPELISLLAGSRFDANNFVTLGYNSPEYATADYLSRNFGSIELRQDFVQDKVDTLFIKSADKTTLDLNRYDALSLSDSSPDCLRIELNYANSILRIFYSNGEPTVINTPTDAEPEKTTANPAHCSNQPDNDAAVSWIATGAFVRQ
ncbi:MULTISPECIES: hypothetical protein [unclassified Marinobacter]|uniref:hypothetical protein n=1 Tax=unclassified Marinobacter TaxID=83889 RepID=UPI0026E14796|nr:MULTISPECIES: hypothetical protein [unclassified Marinobacter]MDO6441875.1 hypothetical protein [Marinobacter sp. 2_MG-2023]MDO6824740.1 hypothetical protein [Marinobacter sp. 1_MG-2023]